MVGPGLLVDVDLDVDVWHAVARSPRCCWGDAVLLLLVDGRGSQRGLARCVRF